MELIGYLQRKQFRKMNTLVENMEEALFEANKQKGWKWVHEEPLWCTWSLEKFGTSFYILFN